MAFLAFDLTFFSGESLSSTSSSLSLSNSLRFLAFSPDFNGEDLSLLGVLLFEELGLGLNELFLALECGDMVTKCGELERLELGDDNTEDNELERLRDDRLLRDRDLDRALEGSS